MKPAAFVSNGPSLAATLDELRALDAKVFALPAAMDVLTQAGIHCQPLGDPIGVRRIRDFGHREIHLFGFDLCNPEGEGTRIAFESAIYWTSAEKAAHAQRLVETCMELSAKGANIKAHGHGMFQAMVRAVMRDMSERVLTALYDLTVAPPTYEIFNFLSAAEKYRVENGFTCIDLLFLPGPMFGFRDDGLPPSVPEREAMLHRICVSGARLLPSVRNVHVMRKRAHIASKDVFPPDWTNDRPRFAYGPKFQKNGLHCLRATDAARNEIAARFEKPYTTITLREAEYWPTRNSNRAAWERAARHLLAEGHNPVVVPDTHGSGINGAINYDIAAWDVDLRLALYEGAALNLFISNGPMALPMLAVEPCPYIMFLIQDGTVAVQAEFLKANGIEHGDQWSDNGLTLWESDTPENVMRALNGWFEKKRLAA